MALPSYYPYKKFPPVVDYEEVLWSPSDVNPALWLDASDLSTITVTDSGVSQWRDKSGSGKHAIQETDNIRPSQSTINGLNAISFSSGKRFSLQSAVDITSEQTVVAVYTRPTTGIHSIFLGNNTDGGYAFYLYSDNYLYTEFGLTNIVRSSATISTGTFAHSCVRSALVLNLYSSGVVIPLTAATSTGGTQYTQIGARRIANSEFTTGNLGELIVVNTSSVTVREKLEGYVSRKWGLLSTMLIGHPFKATPPLTEKPLNYFTPMNLEGDGSEYGINSLSIPR